MKKNTKNVCVLVMVPFLAFQENIQEIVVNLREDLQ